MIRRRIIIVLGSDFTWLFFLIVSSPFGNASAYTTDRRSHIADRSLTVFSRKLLSIAVAVGAVGGRRPPKSWLGPQI